MDNKEKLLGAIYKELVVLNRLLSTQLSRDVIKSGFASKEKTPDLLNVANDFLQETHGGIDDPLKEDR